MLTRDKFRRNQELRERLVSTGAKSLINIQSSDARMGGLPNVVSDELAEKLYWGKIGEKGENTLGLVLEKVRYSIANDSEVEDWLRSAVKMAEEISMLPVIEIEVFKDGSLDQSITLENKEIFTFGKSAACDVPLLHDSLAPIHAALIMTQDEGVKVVDFGSKFGTHLNGKKLEGNFPAKIAHSGDEIQFGASNRSYKITIDYTKMQRAAE